MWEDTSTATSGVATESVPNVPPSSTILELTSTHEVCNPVTTDETFCNYTHECSYLHDPSSCSSTSCSVWVMEKTSEYGLQTNGLCYDEEVKSEGLSNCDVSAEQVGTNHSLHSINHSNKRVFEGISSDPQNFNPALTPEQLEEQHDRKFS